MSDIIDKEKAQEVLGNFSAQAEKVLDDEGQLETILKGAEDRLKTIPNVGQSLSRLPLMLSLIRSYIAKEYTNVSPKVVISMVSALIYLLKGKDLIPDKTPLIGYLDDIAVTGIALKLVEKELDDYSAWRAQRSPDE
jgi:uncharacterized membrane protein YkvA (DUF1232 family)